MCEFCGRMTKCACSVAAIIMKDDAKHWLNLTCGRITQQLQVERIITTTRLCYFVASLHLCFVSSLLRCLIASLSHCFVISLLRCLTASLSHCFVVSLLRCLTASLPHCFVVSLLRCLTASLSHCFVVSLLRCLYFVA